MKPSKPRPRKSAKAEPIDILGVTISTPAYRHLEKDAIRRFKLRSGLEVKVIRRRKDSEGFLAKLQLDQEVGQRRIIFFDLDWWALDTLDFKAWDGREFMAVHDPAVFHPDSFCYKDCFEGDARLEQLRYFNTGFFAVDFRRPEMRRVFEIARNAEHEVSTGKREKPSDKTDQYYINHGVLKVGIPVKYLPASYNYYDKGAQWGFIPHRPRFVIGLHAAGEKIENKLAALKAQEMVWGRTHTPVRPEALLYQHMMCHEIR